MIHLMQKTLISIQRSMAAILVSRFTGLYSTALTHYMQITNNIFSSLLKSDLYKLETSHTVIIPPTRVSALANDNSG